MAIAPGLRWFSRFRPGFRRYPLVRIAFLSQVEPLRVLFKQAVNYAWARIDPVAVDFGTVNDLAQANSVLVTSC